MKTLLPEAVFIGFTGTPLLKSDKPLSLETFGQYIHTYKYDEAVADKVVLDLRYEARDIDQQVTSQRRLDQLFELKTQGLTDIAKAHLKKRWGTMRGVFSSADRLNKIVADIEFDMERYPRLKSGRGNAMLVSDSIYSACRLFELFQRTELAGKCAIVTSYKPTPNSIKGEETGEGLTERLLKNEIYRKMLAAHFNQSEDEAAMRHLLDTYIRAEESQTLSAFEDMTLVELIVEQGRTALDLLPESIRNSETATPETIENNVRQVIVEKTPENPKYYEELSEVIDALIRRRRQEAIEYEAYLARILDLTEKIGQSETQGAYPPEICTQAQRALFDNIVPDVSGLQETDNARAATSHIHKARPAIATRICDRGKPLFCWQTLPT